MNSAPSTSMSDSFFSHGLAGIDLHHAETTRSANRSARHAALAGPCSGAGPIRHRIGQLMIALGYQLAGQAPVQPRPSALV